MKGRVLALGKRAGRAFAALLEDGRLEALALATAALAPEAIVRGRLDRPVKGLGGAFVTLPEGERGFLKDIRGLAPGTPVLAQVTGWPDKGKAWPLTRRLMLKGRFAILTPGAPGVNLARTIQNAERRSALAALAEGALKGADPNLGLIIRSAAAEALPEAVLAEIASLRQAAEALAQAGEGPPALLRPAPKPTDIALRDWATAEVVLEDPSALDQIGVFEALEALLQPSVALPDGAQMTLEVTRALVAVDVDTGADTSPASALKANIAAARELPRQLRLRGLGGQVVIDFASVAFRDRPILEQVLEKAFRPEADLVVLAGWSKLGLFEMTRKRDRVPLAEWWR